MNESQSSPWLRPRGGEQRGSFFCKEMADPASACGLSIFDRYLQGVSPLEAEDSAWRKVSLHLVTEENS